MVCQWLPWSPNGETVVATVIAQLTLLVSVSRQSGGEMEAELSLKLINNVYISTHFLRGHQWPTPVHPFCDHGNVCAFLLPPVSDLWAIDLLGEFERLFWTCSKFHDDHGVHGKIWTSSVPPLNDQVNVSASFVTSMATIFVVAQARHKGCSPCVRGLRFFVLLLWHHGVKWDSYVITSADKGWGEWIIPIWEWDSCMECLLLSTFYCVLFSYSFYIPFYKKGFRMVALAF